LFPSHDQLDSYETTAGTGESTVFEINTDTGVITKSGDSVGFVPAGLRSDTSIDLVKMAEDVYLCIFVDIVLDDSYGVMLTTVGNVVASTTGQIQITSNGFSESANIKFGSNFFISAYQDNASGDGFVRLFKVDPA